MSRFKFTPFQILVHLGSLVPFALLIWDYFTDHLTANPIQAITLRTGKTALGLLCLSLTCTPLNSLFRFRAVLKVRRALGLYAFFYVCLHFLTFIGLDYGFDLGLIYDAIFEKPFALVGFTAFLLLIPLALTSTQAAQKRLGKKWKTLHRLVYFVTPLVVTHYLWSVKADIRQPLLFGVGVLILLLLRVPPIRRRLPVFNLGK